MKEIKKIFNKLGKKYTNYSKKFLITNISIILFTLYLMIFGINENNFIVERIFILLISSSLLVEVTFNNIKKRIPLYILSVLLSIIIPFLLSTSNNILLLIYVGLVGILLSLSLYVFIKKSGKIENYFCHAFYNLFKVWLFTVILLIGFGIIYMVTQVLILEGYDIEFYEKIYYFLMGAYFIPFTIISFDDVKDEIPEIINTLIKRVLLILLDLSYLIIAIYMLLMLIKFRIPKNEVFLVVTSLFLFTIPMVIMLSNYKGKIEELNVKYTPYIFIVALLVQIYSLSIRIYNYGMTTVRYAGIYIILFEIITLFLLLFKKRKYFKYTFLSIPIFIFIMFILPFANIYEAPIYMQINRLENIWKEDTLTSEFTALERQKIKDIYEYLKEHDDVNRYMPKYLTMSDINEYLMNSRSKYEGEESRYFYFQKEDGKVDIKGYTSLEDYDYSANNISIEDFKIEINDENIVVYEELAEYIRNNELPEDKIIFTTTKGNTFVVTYLSFVFNEREEVFENVSLTGYILYK